MKLLGLLAVLAWAGCSDNARPALDARQAADGASVQVDAGPKSYARVEDFPREACDNNDSLENFAYLGKWHNVPDDGSTEFDSYFIVGDTGLQGRLDLIPADQMLVDANNLFLHRTYNSTALAVNLCAVVDQDTLSGYMAKCNGMACTLGTVQATLVEPVTQ